MSFLHRSGEKRKSVDDFDYKDHALDSMDTGPSSPKYDNEKRIRREIANSNERRRMQSINAGFQSLKTIIPHHDGEKLSKAAILQQTSEYITNLESEKARLLSQNAILRQMLKELNHDPDAIVGAITDQITPPPKRKKRDTESSDEGISLGFDEPHVDELKKEVIDLRGKLERERRLRMTLEERNQRLAAETDTVSDETETEVVVKAEEEAAEEKEVEKKSEMLSPALPTSPAHSPITPAATPLKPQPSPTTTIPAPATSSSTPTAAAAASAEKPLKPEAPAKSEAVPMAPRLPVFASSMSKRNLETIVEAIRHLEGDHVLCDYPHCHHASCGAPAAAGTPATIPHSEESQPEESSCSEDDEELELELKSESSGRDSPPLVAAPVSSAARPLPCSHAVQASGGPSPLAGPVVAAKWPLPPPGLTSLQARPAVIVQKSL